jgi:hypothetical protein
MNKLIINQAAAHMINVGAFTVITVQYFFHITYNIIINLKDFKNKLR